jgi:hypothetical protein
VMRSKRRWLATMSFPGGLRRVVDCCPKSPRRPDYRPVVARNRACVAARLISAELSETIGTLNGGSA